MTNNETFSKEKDGIFYSVWGDLVALRELLLASIIGVIVTMGAYFIAKTIFMQNPNLSERLATGYALFAGIGGCIVSCVIDSVLFRPKRTIFEDSSEVDLVQFLKDEDVDLEKEREELANAPEDVLREMRENGLGALLDFHVSEDTAHKES